MLAALFLALTDMPDSLIAKADGDAVWSDQANVSAALRTVLDDSKTSIDRYLFLRALQR